MAEPLPDIEVAGYRVDEVLGRGAVGTVVRARHGASGTPVALKLVSPRTAREQAALEAEVLAMARLNHPGLAYLYDYGVTEGAQGDTFWLAMELASGGSLEGWLPADHAQLCEVLRPLLAALSHAHAHDLTHRDLKPANLLRATPHDQRPGLKLADFGLAQVRGVETAIRRGGTPLYMPPEQIRAGFGEVGPWSDLYALAAVIWHWVTGRPPYVGGAQQLIRQHAVSPLPAFLPRFEVPEALETTLRAMLSKQAATRPRTVHEVRSGLLPPRVAAGDGASAAWVERPGARLPGIGAGLLALRAHRVVGRTEERGRLHAQLLALTSATRPRVVWLHGAPGVGTSRLLRWLAETAAESGVAAVQWGAPLSEHTPTPAVLCLDDAPPSADTEATVLGLLAHEQPLLIAVASHVPPSEELAALSTVSTLAIGPLAPHHARDLAHDELGASGSLALRLATHCAEHPGRIVATMVALAQAGALGGTPDGFDVPAGPLPSLPEADAPSPVLEQVLGEATDAERYGLRLGALLGPRVDMEEWRASLRPDHRVPVVPLRRLLRAGLLRRSTRTIHWVDEAARRHVLEPRARPEEHAAVARGLASLPSSDDRALRRGIHHLHGGAPELGRALLLSHRRAVQPTDMEALQRVVAAAEPHLAEASPVERVAWMLMNLRVHLNLVSGPAAVAPARALLEALGSPSAPTVLAEGIDPALTTEALEFVARVFTFEELHDDAWALLSELPPTPAVLRCQGMVLAGEKRFAEAERCLRQALADSPSPHQQGRIANGIAAMLARSGRHEQSLVWFERAAQLIEPELVYTPATNLAAALLFLDRPEQALPHARRAFRAARDHGAHRLAFPCIIYAVCAAVCAPDELDALADQALLFTRRYGLADASELAEWVEARCVDEPAAADFLVALAHALRHPSRRPSLR
jgi:tetratricopeptide (TPR) repeat protein